MTGDARRDQQFYAALSIILVKLVSDKNLKKWEQDMFQRLMVAGLAQFIEFEVKNPADTKPEPLRTRPSTGTKIGLVF